MKVEKDSMCKSVKILNSMTEVLDEILMKGKSVGDWYGLGFSKSMNMSEKQKPHKGKQKIEFVKAKNSESYTTTGVSSSTSQRKVNPSYRLRWICHHCKKKCHKRPFCFQLLGSCQRPMSYLGTPQVHRSMYQRAPRVEQKWRVKTVRISCNVVLTLFQSSAKGDRYFDSGSSKHMTSEKRLPIRPEIC